MVALARSRGHATSFGLVVSRATILPEKLALFTHHLEPISTRKVIFCFVFSSCERTIKKVNGMPEKARCLIRTLVVEYYVE